MVCKYCNKEIYLCSQVMYKNRIVPLPEYRHSKDNLFSCFDDNLNILGTYAEPKTEKTGE